jgi:hypothetical protein
MNSLYADLAIKPDSSPTQTATTSRAANRPAQRRHTPLASAAADKAATAQATSRIAHTGGGQSDKPVTAIAFNASV